MDERAMIDVDMDDEALEGYMEEIEEIEKSNKSYVKGAYAHNMMKSRQAKLNIKSFFTKKAPQENAQNKNKNDSNQTKEGDFNME